MNGAKGNTLITTVVLLIYVDVDDWLWYFIVYGYNYKTSQCKFKLKGCRLVLVLDVLFLRGVCIQYSFGSIIQR